MKTVTIRNLPEATHRALRVRAALHGRSTEAEIRNILEAATRQPERVRIGAALAKLGRSVGLTEDDIAAIERTHDRSSAQPVVLE